MEKRKFNYDLINAVKGTYLGTLSDSPEIFIGEDRYFSLGDLERNNSRRRRICKVINIEQDIAERKTYKVYIKPIESWQLGDNSEFGFRDSVDWSGSDGWLKRE